MIEALHLGSMLPATLGACCVAGGADRRSPLAWLGMLAMLAAMADTMLLPRPVVPAIVWAAVLVGLALATAVRGRLARSGGGERPHPAGGMDVHRALQAVLTAGLVVAAAGHHAGAHPSAGGLPGAHDGHSLPIAALIAAAALVFALASGWLAARPRQPILVRAEATLGAAAVALMALPLLV